MLYEVTHGGRIITGPNPDALFPRVSERIGTTRIGGEDHPYDMGTFLDNVEGLGVDIRAGVIAEPADEQGWEDAIVGEFSANLKALGH